MMIFAMLVVLLIVNLVLLVPVAVFAIEVVAATTRRRADRPAAPETRPDVAVVVPAHQEEGCIGRTIAALQSQLRAGDRLLVVADNCSDATAQLARDAGAEVVERHDDARRGKGFALDAGVRHLEAQPPAVVVIVDADCSLHPGSVDRLAAAVAASQRPVQGLYLMQVPPGAGLGLQVAEFAFLVKNRVRPAGLLRLGLPCHLTGTGMAFPWAVMREADLAHSNLVEDMKLGLDLAMAGKAPLYCEAARVDSDFPYSEAGAATQRRRWEEGHLGMIGLSLSRLPGALLSRRIDAVALALDTLVPPLTLLLLLVGAAFLSTLLATFAFGLPGAALWIAGANLGLILFALSLAWVVFGRRVLPARSLVLVVPYVLRKLGLYVGLGLGRRSGGWIRTDRQGPKS
jgi:cellulose synthase/poly-beta-1,6-N-acetylglucosamine synthase-like glycosyltransferase